MQRFIGAITSTWLRLHRKPRATRRSRRNLTAGAIRMAGSRVYRTELAPAGAKAAERERDRAADVEPARVRASARATVAVWAAVTATAQEMVTAAACLPLHPSLR